MKGLIKYIALLLFVFGTTKGYGQQTIQFSQYIFNGMAVNPAYAGYKDNVTLNLSSRMQWVGINGAPRTNTISIDGLTNSETKNVGLGLLASTDQLGPQSTTSVYANYAYRIRFDANDTKRLCFGIAAGLLQYSIDASKFNATDVSDGLLPTGDQSKLTPDFRVGVYYYSSSIYIGASVLSLIPGSPNNSSNAAIVTQIRHVYLTAGGIVPLSASLSLKPSIMIKEDFRGPTNVDLTTFLLMNKALWLGASYRTGVPLLKTSNLQTGLDKTDAFAAMAEFYAGDSFRIGYAYDFSTSALISKQSGSHELSLTYSFRPKKPRIISPRYF
ncbi:type IX secretion system membrane protein PorP/SprF [Mucilaginibacter sp. HMF5004]|uniref:PorP/SprF family type IX secretion system membrane protein n=1 Tax=Mucilaginibacter rivuli TaxID=2857527 RepID=UPI001C5EEBD6|nr:type IX secretion system membrane protein PorP/SprF [Mucilaginibacter rivuli]MBW4890294.1 type IX secretion system membrane protein PorP/SprF [Mucilaginibacter rivuli]